MLWRGVAFRQQLYLPMCRSTVRIRGFSKGNPELFASCGESSAPAVFELPRRCTQKAAATGAAA
jgi:hypothetical protein